MHRPTWKAGVITALVIAVAVLAASSGPVRLWVVAPSSDDGSEQAVDPPEPAQATPSATPDDDAAADLPEWVGTALQYVAVGIALIVLALFVYAASGGRIQRRLRPPRWRPRRQRPHTIEPLPEEDTLTVDIDAVHLAWLTSGDIPW